MTFGAHCSDDAGVIDPRDRGGAGHETSHDGDFGKFVVDWVDGGGVDADQNFVGGKGSLGGIVGKRGGGVEREIGDERGGGAGELPGAHCAGE